MGLDVTAYETAALLDPHETADSCYDDHLQAFVIDPSFDRSLGGLIADRCYNVSGRTATVSNSYGGHGAFRDRLARTFLGVSAPTVWYAADQYADRPFFELIHFADNEGTIGPAAASDLLADFEAGRDRWRSTIDHEWLRGKYDEWTEVFRCAASGGLVDFA